MEEGFVMFLQGLKTIQKLQKYSLEKKEDYVKVEAENLEILNSDLKTRKVIYTRIICKFIDFPLFNLMGLLIFFFFNKNHNISNKDM